MFMVGCTNLNQMCILEILAAHISILHSLRKLVIRVKPFFLCQCILDMIILFLINDDHFSGLLSMT